MGRQWRRSWEETLSGFVHLPEPRISHLYTALTPPEPQGTEWQRGRGAHIKCPAWCALRGQVNAGAAFALMLLVMGCFFPPLFPHRAIQEILLTSSEGLCPGASSERSRFDSDSQLAMELSAKELEEWELRLQGRRRSSSKSYSCLSRRNRPFCSRAAQSRASGLHAGAASLVPWG